ncbi:major facilitator superfamily transporter [Phyllosticta citrichinensis]|uniref:Major facilitator superfamily transporter n=1 Tax=Phyllosticta citrichinensis TaxID=1130410 RepID=A0ABR1Y103_9PEZI
MEADTGPAPESSQLNTKASDLTSNEKKDGVVENSSHTTVEVEHGVVLKHGLRLHPQPTSDPLDPLNWSTARKNSILVILMALYFEFTYLTTTTVPSFPQIEEQYGITLDQVNWTVAIPALGLSVGPFLCSPLADIFGRRIVFIVGTLMAFISTIGAAVAPNYGGYMAARFFQGLGAAPASTVGMAIINDMFFEYQRGLKLGLWVLALDMGLLLGPLVGGFMDLVDQYWVQWLNSIQFGVILLAEIFFLPETLYPRNKMLKHMPYVEGLDHSQSTVDIEKTQRAPSVATEVELKRTKNLPFFNFKPVPGMQHPSVLDHYIRFGKMFALPTVSVSVLSYGFGWYWWIISIITYIPTAYAQYSPQIQGLLFIGLILGTLFAELFCSGRLSDWIILKLTEKNGGVRVAEMRLWLVYPACLVTTVGLILWGISIDKGYHWIVGQIAFFLIAAGIQTGNTILAAYTVDCYPLQSMSVVTFYAVFLNFSAFVDPFFIVPWVEGAGYTWSFAAQGIITAFSGLVVMALIHRFGPRIRAKTGEPGWVNPEYGSF